MPPTQRILHGIADAILHSQAATLLLQYPATSVTSTSSTPLISALTTYDSSQQHYSTTDKLLSEIISVFQDLTPSSISSTSSSFQQHLQSTYSEYTHDKSSAELLFVIGVVIAVVVFVIVLPAVEAYFLRNDDVDNEEELRKEEEEMLRYYYLLKNHNEVPSTSSLRVYTPHRGVVEMSTAEVVEMTSLLLRECGSSSCSGSSTLTSGSMETIYEEDEEGEEEAEEEEEFDVLSPSSPTPSSPTRSSRMMDDELKKKLFQDQVKLSPPLSSPADVAPQ